MRLTRGVFAWCPCLVITRVIACMIVSLSPIVLSLSIYACTHLRVCLRYRSYGESLRFLALARDGLVDLEVSPCVRGFVRTCRNSLRLALTRTDINQVVSLLHARNAASTMDCARFGRMRTELIDHRILVVVGGVIDFASAGLRRAAHTVLFSDHIQRLEYVRVLLEWLQVCLRLRSLRGRGYMFLNVWLGTSILVRAY